MIDISWDPLGFCLAWLLAAGSERFCGGVSLSCRLAASFSSFSFGPEWREKEIEVISQIQRHSKSAPFPIACLRTLSRIAVLWRQQVEIQNQDKNLKFCEKCSKNSSHGLLLNGNCEESSSSIS